MKLPNYDCAIVERSKLVDYLLADKNPSGKAGFFTRFGFTASQWQEMREALCAHAAEHEVSYRTSSTHGVKYVVDGKLSTPDGRNPHVRAVWIVENHSTQPRLVTAYRLKGK